jgi:hypothetical protein
LANRDCKLKLTNMLITDIGIRLETDVPYTQRICIGVSDFVRVMTSNEH